MQEQKAAEEARKLGELTKQIQEERQIQELRQLQVAHGQAVKTVDTTLDWMYEGPSAQLDQTSEEYLLGKIYKPSSENANSSLDLKQLAGVAGSKEGGGSGGQWLSKISTKNDLFTRVHEDPLLVMKKNEKASRESVLNNPVKMAKIRHSIAADIARKEEEKRLKKEEKKAKREKKESKKSKKRELSRSPSRSRSEDDRERRNRSRSVGEDRSSKYQRNEDSRVSSRYDEESRGRGRRSSVREEGRDSRDGERDGDRGSRREGEERDRRYGLLSRDGGREGSVPEERKEYLGPRPDLLKKKAEREAAEALERRRPRETAQGLSEEEKARRLEAMRRDAEINDALRLTRHAPHGREVQQPRPKEESASFLQSMRADVYLKEGGANMEERLRQNRHYVQKMSDDHEGSAGFMRR